MRLFSVYAFLWGTSGNWFVSSYGLVEQQMPDYLLEALHFELSSRFAITEEV